MMYKHVSRVIFMKKLFIKFFKIINWILQRNLDSVSYVLFFSKKKKELFVIQRDKDWEEIKESYCRKYFSLAQLLRRGKSSINRKIVAQRWKWLEVNVSNPFTPLAQLKKAL